METGLDPPGLCTTDCRLSAWFWMVVFGVSVAAG